MQPDRLPAIGCVVLAASLWATIGTSYELILGRGDASPLTVVTVRALTASALLWSWIAVRDRRSARIARRDVPALAALGIVSVTIFYVALIYTFRWTSVSTGTILLYCAPAMVAAGSWLIYGDALTRGQVRAIALALLGCFLAAGALDRGAPEASLPGIVLGLVSAAAYGSYSLFAKPLVGRYGSTTIVAYVFTTGTAGLVLAKLVVEPRTWPSVETLALIATYNGIVTTLAPMVLFTVGLRSLPPGIASTTATVEPVVAVGVAAIVLGEPLTAWKLAGGALVLVGILSLARAPGQQNAPAERAGALPITSE